MNHKQIIIFSEDKDTSTAGIMRWCKMDDIEVHRINSDDKKLKISISDNSVDISTSYDTFNIRKNSICWFRRAELPSVYIPPTQIENTMESEIAIFNFIERKQSFNSLKSWIKNNCKYSSDFINDAFNKVDVLMKAKQEGIAVPEWTVAEEKEKALQFAAKYEFVACKPFTSFFFQDKDIFYKNLTEKLTYAEISKFASYFIPRFFQQYIEKKYELRSFYFHGHFFTYAILSQCNPKTIVDFRNYDEDKPNRCVPYNLPVTYSKKLEKLMNLLGLDTGSFDILVDSKDDYYFLEVNPVGQFGYGSLMTNANIEKYIADYLINNLL